MISSFGNPLDHWKKGIANGGRFKCEFALSRLGLLSTGITIGTLLCRIFLDA